MVLKLGERNQQVQSESGSVDLPQQTMDREKLFVKRLHSPGLLSTSTLFKCGCLVHHFQPAVLIVLFLLFSLIKFEGSSLHQLVLKICRGYFQPVSPKYSYDLRTLISQLFKVSPRDRPSVNSILRKPFLQKLVLRYLPPEVSALYCCLPREKGVLCYKQFCLVLFC